MLKHRRCFRSRWPRGHLAQCAARRYRRYGRVCCCCCRLVSRRLRFYNLRFIGRGKKALAHPSPLPLSCDRRGSEALARPRSPDGAAPPRQHHPQRDGQDRACPPRRPSPLLPRPPSLGEMPQTSRTREVQIDPTRPPGDVEPPRGPARPAPEPRPGPHPHTPPCDLDDACRKTRKVTLTCGSGSSPQSP